ncbi:MAG: rhombosortase [Opitutaceae bacterium]|jgi:rhomboid family GlyGly-CTERM serine protease
MKRLPFATLMLAALAVAIHFVPVLGNLLEFDRAAVAHGQAWRFFTAHLAHFSDDHLRWDLLAFVLLGTMAERISRRGFLLTCGLSAAVITAGVWIAQPQFATYRGLSGVDSALFGFVLADLFVKGWREQHGFSMAVGVIALASFGGKCAFELATGGTVFVETCGAFAPVPLAHLLGLAAGTAVAALLNRRSPGRSDAATAMSRWTATSRRV